MNKTLLYILLAAIGMLSCLTACEDIIEYRVDDIPEGHSSVEFDLSFKDFTPALESRTSGTAIKAINNLWVVIYEITNDGYAFKECVSISDKDNFTIKENTRPDGKPSSETSTGHASFKMTLPTGRYEMYAVANMDMGGITKETIDTPDKLKALRTSWVAATETENYVGKYNAEMFGQFYDEAAGTANGSIIEIKNSNTKLHAWLRRCASKVTVAYDGTRLKDGVTIYLMSATIKDIPATCALGENNVPAVEDELIHDGEMITYWKEGINISQLPIQNHEATITNANGGGKTTYGSDHADEANALFFYENMQGEGKDKAQDANKDKEIDYPNPDENTDGSGWKDEKRFGTYIEVEAIYNSTNSDKPGHGLIKYRFMLGKNITTNYDAERNHHYKLTLHFNGFANDIDWHIDFSNPALEVSEPKVFDYRGKVFMPDNTIPNGGHTFDYGNMVSVKSYMVDDAGTSGQLVPYVITYQDDCTGEFKSESSWLTLNPDEIQPGRFPYEKYLPFKVKTERNDVKSFKIDNILKNTTQKGTATAPYNLANPGQTVSPASATIQNTANCYIVDAPGYYIFPLVYGNAIKNGGPNAEAYEPNTSAATKLGKFKNHLGNVITSPYIRQNAGCNDPKRASLVLQDENDLLMYNCWDPTSDNNIKYIPEAYNGNGGIMFYINPANIKQGNAIIALLDRGLELDENNNAKLIVNHNIPVMWSWHIWVTSFSEIPETDETIRVTTGVRGNNGKKEDIDFMPMNLGWCSAPDDVIKYYPARKCKVRFTSGELTEEIIIEQKSHIAFTYGNNPYYQWGRKDPFMGAPNDYDPNNDLKLNKPRYIYSGWSFVVNYSVLNGNYLIDDNRIKTTYVDNGNSSNTAIAQLIQYPYLWHNPPREAPGYSGNKFQSLNETYSDLWGGGAASDGTTVKTIYDPCPVGYKVPHYNAFTGFTTRGTNTNVSNEWYDAIDGNNGNIEDYVTTDEKGTWEKTATYYENLYEFYTNPDKTQSIIFPACGYRDWDNGGHIFDFKSKGYTWTAIECTNANYLSNGNYREINDWTFNFDFARPGMTTTTEGFIRPNDIFFSCDGFPVRPVKE